MERGHPVRQRAQHARYFQTKEYSRRALRRTGCPRSATGRLSVDAQAKTACEFVCGGFLGDNNQHAENENIRLQNLWDGIETMAAVMTMKPKF
jgi:acetylornithine deacetylase/succinyl-diaminopimelate desuccinylase-like protein